MKKTYVKPMMESEEFVANEYVATCYTATCSSCGASETGYGALASKITSGTSVGDDADGNPMYLYTGTLDDVAAENCESTSDGGKKPAWIDNIYQLGDSLLAYAAEEVVWGLYKIFVGNNETVTYYHPVSLSDQGWGNHPNASV